MDIGYTKTFEQQEDSRMSGNKRSVHMEDLHDDNDHPVFPKTPFSKKMRTNDGTPGTVASYEDNESPMADDNHDDKQDDDHVEDTTEEEPDWDALRENGPAAQDQVEIFLKAREIRDEADDRFSSVMDECNTMLEATKKQILQAAADMHNMHREELDYLETEIKQTLVWNHQVRTKMKQELEETQNRAQGLFSQLLMTVSQPLKLFGGGSKRNDSAAS